MDVQKHNFYSEERIEMLRCPMNLARQILGPIPSFSNTDSTLWLGLYPETLTIVFINVSQRVPGFSFSLSVSP